MANLSTEIIKYYRIKEITDAGRVIDVQYGYGETFKWERFDTIEDAEKYLDKCIDEFNFNRDFVIIAFYEKVWKD